MNENKTYDVRKKSKYALKKIAMKNGTYNGNSPYFQNIQEFQYLKPLDSYPHLKNPHHESRNKR